MNSGSVYAHQSDGQLLVNGSHGVIDLWNLNTGGLYSLFNKYSADDSFLSHFQSDGKLLQVEVLVRLYRFGI